MQTPAILALLLAALPLMGSPGPATISLAATGSAFGIRRGRGYLLGIIAGTTVVLLMVAFGLTGLVLALPNAVPVLAVVAVCYIVYLAYKIATAPVMSDDASHIARPTLWGGFLLAIANPKAFTAIGAVYAGSNLVPDDPVHDAFAKIVVLTLVIVIVNSTWLALGATFAALFKKPRTGRLINVGFAVLLLVSVALAFIG